MKQVSGEALTNFVPAVAVKQRELVLFVWLGVKWALADIFDLFKILIFFLSFYSLLSVLGFFGFSGILSVEVKFLNIYETAYRGGKFLIKTDA